MDRTERRIAPPQKFESMLDRLIESKDPSTAGLAIFETKQKALMFAAALGYRRGRRVPLERRGTAIRPDIFQRDLDDAFIGALALAETGDLNVLRSDRDEERATIFEEYAHAGLEEMDQACFKQDGSPVENLIRLTREVQVGEDQELPGIDASVLKGLLG